VSVCGRHTVIHEVDLEVHPGEVVALLGANGAGKTTTLLTLAGELPPHDGEVQMYGEAIKSRLHSRARHGLTFVTEEIESSYLTETDEWRLSQAMAAR